MSTGSCHYDFRERKTVTWDLMINEIFLSLRWQFRIHNGQDVDNISSIMILRCTTNMKTNMIYVLKCIPNFGVYNMDELKKQRKHFQRKVV